MTRAPATRLTRRDGLVIVTVASAFLAVYFTVALPFIRSAIPEPYLRVFDFTENEWFEAKNVKIIDGFGHLDRAVANDELFYDINYANKKSFEIAIQSKLEIVYGGTTVNTISPDPVVLPVDGDGHQRIRFFTDNIGMNQIRLIVTVQNATDSTIYDMVPLTFNIPVYSQEESILLDQNQITFTGVAISIPIGFGTIFGLIISLNLSRRQIAQMTKENELASIRMAREDAQRKSDEQEKLRESIGNHTSRLVHELKPTESYWIDQIGSSRHGERFVKHVFTGDRDLFDRLNDTIKIGKAMESRKSKLKQKLESRILGAIQNTLSSEADIHRFIAEAADHIMNNVGTEKWRDFQPQFKESMGAIHYLTQLEFKYSLVYDDEKKANETSSRLNAIAADPIIAKEAGEYQEARKSFETNSKDCKNALENLVSDIDSKGRKLQGACDSCIGNYAEEEVSKLKTSFDELSKTELYKYMFSKEQ